MVSKRWHDVKLAQIASYKSDRQSLTKRKYISTENMLQNFKGVEYYQSDEIITGIAFTCSNVLIANIRPYLKKVYFADFCGICSPDVLVLEAHESVFAKFLYYCVANDNFIDYVMSGGVKGIKMPRGDKQYIMKYSLSLPTLPEQIAIANTLTAFDTHIANLSELIEKKKAIRDGALEDLVSGRTRLAGFHDKWQDSHVGHILKILHGKNQKDVEASNGRFPIMGTSGVIGKATKFLCDWECVLIGRKGTIDKPYYMDTPFWTIDTLYYSKPAEKQCVKFQYYLFCNINWFDYTESSGRPSLTRKAIEEIEIKVPKYEEQKAIADTLTAMDDEITALEAERDKMIQIREGAMDDLLTGRIRLKVS